MLRQSNGRLRITSPHQGLYEISGDIERWLEGQQVASGLLTLFCRHTSASLLIQENADPEVRRDLERFFSRICPDGDPIFQHTAEGEDDMPAHVRTAMTAVNLSIPFEHGALALGTWQGLYLWEHRHHPHRRRVTVHLLGE